MENTPKEAARRFVDTWRGRGHERSESQTFWNQLLHDVFAVEIPANFITFELPVHLKNAKFIDAYIPSTKVLIEQKSSTDDLRKAKRQSDNEELTPYEQALRYSAGMRYSERPRWIVTSNFRSFLIYDMENPKGEPFEILLENLEREFYLLQFLVEDRETILIHEEKLSIQAGALIGKLYEEFHKGYITPDAPNSSRSLNILCVRLVFCLFAEKSGLFGNNHRMFYDYMMSFKPSQMRKVLIDLFKILNCPYEERDPYEDERLLAFPYVNGGMFAESDIEIPTITKEIKDLLLVECGLKFDWSGISPTIFGALFEDTMNPDTREAGCMHYTSVENIHKVIDPLFLNNLKEELNAILKEAVTKKREARLLAFQAKLASLTFLDPACGSGNFLTETYLCLRRLENRTLKILIDSGHNFPAEENPIKVTIENFFGIEIHDFAVTVAKAALWIAEAQMANETEHIVARSLEFLPLKKNPHIVRGNALLKDWNEVVPKSKLSYIIGNPPFKGKKSRESGQKNDLLSVIGKDSPRPGNMDLACGWFFKAARLMQGTDIQASFVATVNITRGEQVSLLWESLLNKYGVTIKYAYAPFVWDSESMKKAQVHCTIIGFCTCPVEQRVLYPETGNPYAAKNISPYLRDEETVLVYSRNAPLCRDVPKTGIGNKPIDGGNFLFKPDEKDKFVAQEPNSEKYFIEWYGADELIKGHRRYFLWLNNCSPSELRRMPLCMKRIENVRRFRSNSAAADTRKLADSPIQFHVTNLPSTDFIVIPEVTSENRQYIPMEYVTAESAKHKLFSNLVKLMPNVTYYHFGVLESIIHMIWTKGVCGYKDFRPRYSTDIVFNNYPWPSTTDKIKSKIEKTAKAIIDARHQYPDCSLADLYDINSMPDNLRKAHLKNDAVVREAYGFSDDMDENAVIAALLQMYKQLTKQEHGY